MTAIIKGYVFHGTIRNLTGDTSQSTSGVTATIIVQTTSKALAVKIVRGNISTESMEYSHCVTSPFNV